MLRPGGIAGFTVWGRRENCRFFTLIGKACVEAGLELPPDSHDYFYLGVDKQMLIEDAKKAGFKKAVAYYVPSYANFKDGEDAFDRLFKTISPE